MTGLDVIALSRTSRAFLEASGRQNGAFVLMLLAFAVGLLGKPVLKGCVESLSAYKQRLL